MKNFPKVFIIILNYNGKSVVNKCLSSTFKVEYPNFEVVFIDNNSRDGSFELAKSNFSRANFIKNEENLGFANGVNVGIRFALERMADYVLLLNNDTEVEKDFLLKMIEEGEKDNKIGVLSPIIFSGSDKKVWFSRGEIDWLKMRTIHKTKTETEDVYFSEFISGCSMLIKAEVFNKIGLFDENYFLYWEDADFTLRARKAGFKTMVVSSSWVYHFEQSEKMKESKIYWLVLSGLIFFKKNTPFFLKPWVFFYLFLRKTKNKMDVAFKKDKVAFLAQKAYKDFQNARF